MEQDTDHASEADGHPRAWTETSFVSYDECEEEPCATSQADDCDYYSPRSAPTGSSGLAGALLNAVRHYPLLCALVRREQLAYQSPRRHANGRARESLAGERARAFDRTPFSNDGWVGGPPSWDGSTTTHFKPRRHRSQSCSSCCSEASTGPRRSPWS